MFDDRFGAYYDTGQISGGPLTGSAPFSNNGDPLAHAILYSDNVVINNTLQSDAALEVTQDGWLIVSAGALTIATGGLALEGYAAAGGAVTLRMGLIRAGWMAEDMALAEGGNIGVGAGSVYMASRGAPVGGKVAAVAEEALESAAHGRGSGAVRGLANSVRWKGFSKGSLAEHFTKHRAEFGEISQSQYLKMAKGFAQETGEFLEQRVGNFIVRYDPATRRTLVGHANTREIRTFYRADGRSADPFQAAVDLARSLSGL